MSDREARLASRYATPASSPGFRLWTRFLQWQRGLNAALLPYGLTQPQFAILAMCGWLCRSSATTNQRDIVTATGMDKMHVSQIISRLVRAKLIERAEEREDARIKPIAPTPVGWRILSETLLVVETFDAQFFANDEA